MAGVVQVSIEFAHIYADEEFGKDHLDSTRSLIELCRELQNEGESFATTVLIDDFNSSASTLDEACLLKEITRCGASVDSIAYESRFAKIADQLIAELPRSHIKLEYFNNPAREVLLFNSGVRYVGLKEEGTMFTRHTCAVLSAAWSLCRLGVFDAPQGSIHTLSNRPFAANRSITILQNRYRAVEEKVLELIRATHFRECVQRMEYRFF